jgi:hypothetical protein
MFIMSPRLSKAMLTTHITVSVGWIGTIAAFLALSVMGLVGNDQIVRSCYIRNGSCGLVCHCPVLLCIFFIRANPGTWNILGVIQTLVVFLKLILTLIATLILLLHLRPISYLGEVAVQNSIGLDELRGLRIRITADAGAAILVLVAITTVSVYKPLIRIPSFKRKKISSRGYFFLIIKLSVLNFLIVL